MTVSKKSIIEKALEDGLRGSALGSRVTGKGKRTMISSIVGAAIEASIVAAEEAESLGVAVMYEEEGVIYEEIAGKKRKRIKRVKKSGVIVPSEFSLE